MFISLAENPAACGGEAVIWYSLTFSNNTVYTKSMRRTTKLPTIDIKKYGGKQVAIVDGKIIASGRTLSEVIERARRVVPLKPLHEIKIFSVPKSLAVIYYA